MGMVHRNTASGAGVSNPAASAEGSLAGPQVGPSPPHTVVAGAPQSISFGSTDASGFLQSPQPYVITAQQTAGTAVGVTNMVDVEVFV